MKRNLPADFQISCDGSGHGAVLEVFKDRPFGSEIADFFLSDRGVAGVGVLLPPEFKL